MFDSRVKERVMRLEYDAEQQAKKITDLQNEIDQYQKIFGDAILQIAQSFGIETPEIADIKKQSLAEKVIDNFLAQYGEEKEREKVSYIPSLDLSDDSCKQEKNKPCSETLAKRLRSALKIRNISQSELCKMTGIPKSAVSQYVNGAFEPRKKPLKQIAKALDVNEPWLMGWAVPLTKYDGTPEAFNTAKLSDDKNRRSKVVDILYNRMESLSEAENAAEDFTDLCNSSLAMGAVAKAIFFLEQ